VRTPGGPSWTCKAIERLCTVLRKAFLWAAISCPALVHLT
jgi:hypothetical protein